MPPLVTSVYSSDDAHLYEPILTSRANMKSWIDALFSRIFNHDLKQYRLTSLKSCVRKSILTNSSGVYLRKLSGKRLTSVPSLSSSVVQEHRLSGPFRYPWHQIQALCHLDSRI